MRVRTVVGILLVLGTVTGISLVGFLGGFSDSGQLVEVWVSDTARDNEVNHHAVGVGARGEVVVAPVAAVPNVEEITETSCSLVRLGARNGTVLWRATVPPADCFSHALTQPVIEDVDDDGNREVVVGTAENALVAYDAPGGREELRVSLPSYGYGRPTVANLLPAGGSAVVVSDIDGNVFAVRGNGSVIWRRSLNETVWAAPIARDVDGDGDTEVAIGTADGTAVLSGGGSIEWRTDVPATTLAAGQADGDLAIELFATDTRTLVALDGASGAVEWTVRFDESPTVGAVGDVDGDGRAEVVVGLTDQHVVALDASTGEQRWNTEITSEGGVPMSAPVLADVDGDGSSEVIAVANDGTVSVLRPDTGRELAAYRRTVTVWTHPTPTDVDGDGDAEILVRYGDGRVVALDYQSG